MWKMVERYLMMKMEIYQNREVKQHTYTTNHMVNRRPSISLMESHSNKWSTQTEVQFPHSLLHPWKVYAQSQ